MEGTITKLEILRSEGSYDYGKIRWANISYAYEVNGKSYSRNTLRDNGRGIKSSWPWNYELNQKVNVYYKPNNDSTSLLDHEKGQSLFVVVSSIIFTISGGILFIIKGLKLKD